MRNRIVLRAFGCRLRLVQTETLRRVAALGTRKTGFSGWKNPATPSCCRRLRQLISSRGAAQQLLLLTTVHRQLVAQQACASEPAWLCTRGDHLDNAGLSHDTCGHDCSRTLNVASKEPPALASTTTQAAEQARICFRWRSRMLRKGRDSADPMQVDRRGCQARQ